MIVRISTEGQYELDDAAVAELNELDNAAVAACESGDEPAFRSVYGELLQFIRDRGKSLPEDELIGSELILPPPDVTLEEAAADFSGEGLIPG